MGKLKLDISHGQLTEFKIITPTSVASVKGTRFWIDVDGKKGDVFYGLSGAVEIVNSSTGEKVSLTENTMVTSLPDGTLSIKKIVSKELMQLEILEQEVGEPINDMPINDLEDDSGSLFEDDLNNISNMSNEIVIELRNLSSDKKKLIIKYTD